MIKKYLRHWPYFLTGPVLSFLLIVFWYFNRNYLSLEKSQVSMLLESPLLTFGLIILGAFISSFISGEYDIKTPVTYEPLIFAYVGGLIMGCGAVIAAMSLNSVVLFNLAGIFNLTAFMVTKGWLYAIFMILGGFAGSKLFLYLILKTQRLKKNFYIPEALTSDKNQKITFFILLTLFILFVTAVALFSPLMPKEKARFLFLVILLVLFGMVVERGTICMSSMLKEWFIAKSAYVWRSVLFTVMCLALLYQGGLKLSLYQPIQVENNILNFNLLAAGSFMMGLGFIFADGCFIGSLWKAGQGNIINLAGILGMIIGIGATQIAGKFMYLNGIHSTIPNHLNYFITPALFLTLLWAIGVFLLVVFKPKHYRY